MSTRDAGYTKTGNSWLASFANKASFVPLIGGFISVPLIAIDSLINSVGWLLRGKPLSAASEIGTGVASASLAYMNNNPVFWLANVASGITTGRSIQTHGRKITEGVTSFVTKPLGVQPTVLRSYYAGVGGVAGAAPAQPGRFATNIANERGQNAQAMYNNYMRGEGGVHVNELGSAAQGRA